MEFFYMEFKHTQLNGSNYTDADIKRLIAEYNVQFIKLQFVDINGQIKNQYSCLKNQLLLFLSVLNTQ